MRLEVEARKLAWGGCEVVTGWATWSGGLQVFGQFDTKPEMGRFRKGFGAILGLAVGQSVCVFGRVEGCIAHDSTQKKVNCDLYFCVLN